MCRFIETMLFDGQKVPLIGFHQDRVDRTFDRFFADRRPHDLAMTIGDLQLSGIQKVRVAYDGNDFDISSEIHTTRKINSLKLVIDDEISYAYKYEDRAELNRLFGQRGSCDEIIIIRHGKVTDTLNYNLAFWDGSEWITPSHCLLKGVRRRSLMDTERISAGTITVDEVARFEKVSLINALTDLEQVVVPVSRIEGI